MLYDGRQIYFGNVTDAKEFFFNMGFDCPPRQTTADFLTSITNPAERIIRPDFAGKTPFTPEEFEKTWHGSDQRAQLLDSIAQFDGEFPLGGSALDAFKRARQASQAPFQ